MDLCSRAGRVKHQNALRLGSGQFEETLPYPFVELHSFPFKSVRDPGRGAFFGPRQTHLDRAVKEKGDVRNYPSARNPVEEPKHSEIDPATIALIGQSGVRESVAQNKRAPGEGGLNHVLNMLGAVRKIEKKFRGGSYLLLPHLKENPAHHLSQLCSTRLAGRYALRLPLSQISLQQPDLGGLSRPVATLE
jgi:hypothetical protein